MPESSNEDLLANILEKLLQLEATVAAHSAEFQHVGAELEGLKQIFEDYRSLLGDLQKVVLGNADDIALIKERLEAHDVAFADLRDQLRAHDGEFAELRARLEAHDAQFAEIRSILMDQGRRLTNHDEVLDLILSTVQRIDTRLAGS